jgi:hexokinase
MRAGWLRLQPGSAVTLGPIVEAKVPRRGSVSPFFAAQADLVARACPQPRIRVGYCFSYPARITPKLGGVSTQLTKGIQITGLIGSSVSLEVAKALHTTKRRTASVRVLNDAVATLLAAAFVAPKYSHYIGLIVGTGTNMASFFPVKRITKLTKAQRRLWHDDEEMAVNLESGNFMPPHLSHYDDLLDASARGDRPGTQRFEKAVAGAYLPRLFRHVIGDKALREAGLEPRALDARSMAEFRSQRGRIGKTARAILDRSADLVAAGLAGLIQAHGPNPKRVGILVEGSVFWRTPGYCGRIRRRLTRLCPREVIAFLRYPRNYRPPNLLGAACAVLGSNGTASAGRFRDPAVYSAERSSRRRLLRSRHAALRRARLWGPRAVPAQHSSGRDIRRDRRLLSRGGGRFLGEVAHEDDPLVDRNAALFMEPVP